MTGFVHKQNKFLVWRLRRLGRVAKESAALESQIEFDVLLDASRWLPVSWLDTSIYKKSRDTSIGRVEAASTLFLRLRDERHSASGGTQDVSEMTALSSSLGLVGQNGSQHQ